MSEHGLRTKIDRVEEVCDQLQQAESMDPADAKELRDEAMKLIDEVESDLELGEGSAER
jgi:cobalamin biosynthesis Mg chelatase CobN